MSRLAGVALLVAVLCSPPEPGAAAALRPEEAASIVTNLGDLLANEPSLPLPVRQRSDALTAYYRDRGGALIWIGTPRMAALVARLKAADQDGLDPASYPSEQLAGLADGIHDFAQQFLIGQALGFSLVAAALDNLTTESFDFVRSHCAEPRIEGIANL